MAAFNPWDLDETTGIVSTWRISKLRPFVRITDPPRCETCMRGAALRPLVPRKPAHTLQPGPRCSDHPLNTAPRYHLDRLSPLCNSNCSE
eukprot:2087362-Prymnesium_polylepis.1